MLMVLAAHSLWAQDGIEGVLSHANLASPLNLSNPLARTFAGADFDNDHKPDEAVIIDSGRLDGQNSFRIDVHLSGGGNFELIFQSAEIALALTALDINDDGVTDVVVEQALTHQRLYIWLNDGNGEFHRGRTEDFQSADNPIGQFEAASSKPGCTAACLAPQRGTVTDKPAARSLLDPPPSSGEFKILRTGSSPTARAFSVEYSRAPPLSL